MFASGSPTMEEEQLALVSAPQPENMAVAVPSVNDEAPLVNATCIKAACGGALLLAGIAVGAQAAKPQKEAGGGSRGGDAGAAPVQLSQARSSASMGSQEIVDLWVGQCGSKIGANFLGGMFAEHQLSADGKYSGKEDASHVDLARASVYFDETGDSEDHRYVPRTCVIDLEPGTKDFIKGIPLATSIRPANLLFGQFGSAGNFAKGHYTEGAELEGEIRDAIRLELERCNCPQGFQLQHSLGGGTGSGLGTLLLIKLRDDYPDFINTTFSVFPSPKASDKVVEPYNCVLSVHQMLENSDVTMLFDNEALVNFVQREVSDTPTYSNLNALIKSATMGATAPWRFNSNVVTDMRRLTTSIVPFPRLRFLNISHSALIPAHAGRDIPQIVSDLHSDRSFLCEFKQDDGKYMCGAHCFRGEGALSAQELVEKWNGTLSNDALAWWSPYGILSGVAEGKPTVTDPEKAGPCDNTQDVATTGTFLSNTTAIKGVFQRISTQFGKMYKRKAFLHWYKGEGMDEMEFQEADKNVRDLITEYQDKQDAVELLDDESEEESSSSSWR